MTANTRDISDGGIFLMTSTTELYPLGTVLQGQVQNMGVQAPVLNMEIVRIDDDGIALKFLT